MSPRKIGKKQLFSEAPITWTLAVGVQVAAPASQWSAPSSAGRAVADGQISWAFLLAPNDEDSSKEPLKPPGKHPRVIKPEGIVPPTVRSCQEMEMGMNVNIPFLGRQSAFVDF